MKKSLVYIIAAIIPLVLFDSCTKDQYDLPKEIPADQPPQDTTSNNPVIAICDTAGVKYNSYIKTIFQNHCLSCHSQYNTYSAVKSLAESGKLKDRVVDGNPSFMPQGGPLPQATRDSILRWINNGKCE
jgi:hypothetical protein